MSLVGMTRWRTLVLATAGFNLSFLLWFSFAPFMGAISGEFGLSLAELGVLASAAVWMAPFGRMLSGWLSDRYGAPTVFAVVLVGSGLVSVLSGLVERYWVFFLCRLVVGTAGVTFVIGIQHVAQWFPSEQVGTAEGIYAGIGNAGAGAGALLLPQLFGADWRTAFVVTGAASVVLGVVYYVFGEAAATDRAAQQAADGATARGFAHVATRYGVVALSLAYAMSFGLVLAMNGWLPTYFDVGFGSGLTVAGTFAAAFALASGVLRPISGYISDVLVRRERNLLSVFPGRYREQWTFVCLLAVAVLLSVLTGAGLSGNVLLTVVVTVLLGVACGWAGGAIFAQVPEMFPDRTGAAAGVVGGIGTFGGVVYPLLFSYAAELDAIHFGYVFVAVTMFPIVLLNAWLFRPHLAARANVAGFGSFLESASAAGGTDE